MFRDEYPNTFAVLLAAAIGVMVVVAFSALLWSYVR